MKKTFTITLLFISLCTFSQYDIKTVHRPDGITMKYFNPIPVAIASSHEAGLALYRNVTNKFYMLSLTVLFKSGIPKELSGNLMIQTTGTKGLSLEPAFHKLVNMNGREVATSMYMLTERDIKELKSQNIKLISFSVDGQPVGLNLTKNKNVLITEFSKL